MRRNRPASSLSSNDSKWTFESTTVSTGLATFGGVTAPTWSFEDETRDIRAESDTDSIGASRIRCGDCGRAIRLGWVDILVLCRAGHGGSEPTNAVFGRSSSCGTDNLSQPASFLPPCLMKSRESVIPPATNSFSKCVDYGRFPLTGRLCGGVVY